MSIIEKYKEVFDAWIISFNPDEKQKTIAEDRYKVCFDCEFRKSLIKNNRWSEICGKCGCPLNKKIFSKVYNACPLKKWEIPDSKHIIVIEEKNNSTII